MEMYTCIIVDDSEIDQLRLQSFLRKFEAFKIIGTFLSPQKALAVIDEIKVDVLFLDIQMPGINGLEFRKIAHKVPVCIFVSYSPDYAAASFELETLDYLVKPLEFKRFEKTIERITAFMNKNNQAVVNEAQPDSIMIKSGTNQLRISLNDIIYFEAYSDYTQVYTQDGKQIISHSLGIVLKDPVFKSFIRIHRSFAVQKKFIFKLSGKEVILKNGRVLPIGKTYKDYLLQNL
jgi:two-component system LytT family response regulator